MKYRNSRIVAVMAVVMLLISMYQLYWLIGQYHEFKARLESDIKEVLRSSDFEELVHRVDEISRTDFTGRIGVNMGYDHDGQHSVVQSEYEPDPAPMQSSDTHTVVSPTSFGSILKSPEDLMNIGLNMQRGIHASLDAIRDVDMKYLDTVITSKLDSLGLGGGHQILYVRHPASASAAEASNPDTLAKLGMVESGPTDSFHLRISPDSEYEMIIPRWHMAVYREMAPMILFSAFTFLTLVVTFWYIIHTMRKQREVEEIKTDFTNNITHELKTPIAVAYAANDALLNFDASANTPRMNRYLKVCQEQLRLLDRLVEQILSLSMERRKSIILNREDVSLEELANSVISTFRMKYPDKAAFTAEVEDGLVLHTDLLHISNIIGNLIDNAVKYSREEARVTLRAFRDKKGDTVIEVTDEGIGITHEQQKMIFNKFYRVPHGNIHDVKGYGLGLFYVRSMTERLGGTVSVRSVYGKGSSFRLTFKRTDTDAED